MTSPKANIKALGRKAPRRCSAVTEARIDALRNVLRQEPLYLDDLAYRALRYQGFSRGEIHQFIDLMVERGEAVVETCGFHITVRLVEGAEK